MSTKIQILPDYIANQIAAGEVVQRPESVIKELVENSIDAGADTIVVNLKNAGKSLIHIVDNGSGMGIEDLKLSIKRHATSKIFTQEDLEEIKTFGFRGEALASISSVANIEIRSRQDNENLGYQLLSEPNKEAIIEEYACEKGTQIFVRNLFYNVPARKKFLKSNISEFRHIAETMMRFALANPKIRFIFYDDDSLIFDVKPEDILSRIDNVIGKQTSENMIRFDYQDSNMSIEGYIGNPILFKQTRSYQYFFLNGRSIQHKYLSHAVFSAFEHLLDKNQFPMFVIFIELDFKKVDVNVHPQKHEVKFEDEKYIYGVLKNAVTGALIDMSLAPQVNLGKHIAESPFEIIELEDSKERVLVNRQTGEIVETNANKFNNSNANFNYSKNNNSSFNRLENKYNTNANYTNQYYQEKYQSQQNSSQHYSSINNSIFDDLFGIRTSQNQENSSSNNNQNDNSNFEDFWLVHNKYIFVKSEIGIRVIDMHNAHERVLYEKNIELMNKHAVNSQQLLFPIKINLNIVYLTIIQEIETDLYDAGFDFDLIDNNLELTRVPKDFADGNTESLFFEILDMYQDFKKIRHTDKRDNLAATLSCKSAIKTGHKSSKIEIKQLIDDLMNCKMPYVCPHGRPVIIDITLDELDKKFKRTS